MLPVKTFSIVDFFHALVLFEKIRGKKNKRFRFYLAVSVSLHCPGRDPGNRKYRRGLPLPSLPEGPEPSSGCGFLPSWE